MKLMHSLWILCIFSIIGTFVVYPDLPDQIPIHWGIDGQVDRYGNKMFAFFSALLPLLLYGLFLWIPRIDPRKDNYLKHAAAYGVIVLTLTLFMIGLHWVTIAFSLGYRIDVVFMVKFFLGILFVVIGNYLPVVKPNYTLGIRTPWTLADETVWEKTHRIGGYAFVLSGLVWSGLAFVNHPWVFYLLIGELVIFITGIFAYSFVLYNRRHP
jgi:uncharacterized membrane protein